MKKVAGLKTGRGTGRRIKIGQNVIIGRNVTIGDGCVLRNNIVIYDETEIGNGCTIEDGAVLGKLPVMSKALTRKIDRNTSSLRIGSQTHIGTNAVIFKGVKIGHDCLIGDGVNIREGCRIGNRTLISRGVTINYNTVVGNNCKVLDLTHLTGEMVVEDEVFISTHVVSCNDNLMGRDSTMERKGPKICRGALIGGGVCLLPGVTIGAYSVIGSGAVVTKNIPAQKLAFGIPAKVVSDLPQRFKPSK